MIIAPIFDEFEDSGETKKSPEFKKIDKPEVVVEKKKFYKPDYNGDFEESIKLGESQYLVKCMGGIVETSDNVLQEYLKRKGYIYIENTELITK